MSARHSWSKLETHHYVCRKCATEKKNYQTIHGAWVADWFLPTGQTRAGLTPPCAPGPLTESRLAFYAPRLQTSATDE